MFLETQWRSYVNNDDSKLQKKLTFTFFKSINNIVDVRSCYFTLVENQDYGESCQFALSFIIFLLGFKLIFLPATKTCTYHTIAASHHHKVFPCFEMNDLNLHAF